MGFLNVGRAISIGMLIISLMTSAPSNATECFNSQGGLICLEADYGISFQNNAARSTIGQSGSLNQLNSMPVPTDNYNQPYGYAFAPRYYQHQSIPINRPPAAQMNREANMGNYYGIQLPRMRHDINVGYSYADIRGVLTLVDGCIYLKPYGNDNASELYTVVWPPNTRVFQSGNNIAISENTLGNSYTTLGSLTSFSGGLGQRPFNYNPQIHQPSSQFKCLPYPTALVGQWNSLN